MKKFAVIDRDAYLLIVIILLQLIVITYFGIHKNWLFGDEQWTFNLANRYYEPFLGDASKYYSQWLTPDFWNSALAVQPEYAFNYKSVFYNQAQDVHPPLYYVIIHTICSIFPGVYSKWFAIIPNMIFFVIGQIVMFRIGMTLFKKSEYALMTCLVYGFSWGIINNTVYVRMYELLSLWGLVSYYLHLRMLRDFNFKILLLTLLTSLCGILTQYYFLVFQFFVSAGFAINLIVKKKYKQFTVYCMGYLCVLLSAVAIFPASVSQITGKAGNQGQAAFHNLVASSFGDHVSVFGHVISKDIFGGHARWTLEILAVAFFVSFILKFCCIKLRVDRRNGYALLGEIQFYRNHLEFHIKLNDFVISLIYSMFISIFYFCVISKIAPYLESRYMVIIYPLIIVIFVAIVDTLRFINRWKWKSVCIVLILLSMLFAANTYRTKNLFTFDPKYTPMMNIIQKDYHSDIAFIIVNGSKSFWPVMHEALTMRNTSSSLLLDENDLDKLGEFLEKYSKNHDAFLIYKGYPCKMDKDTFEKKVSAITGYGKYKIVDSYMGDIYLFQK